MVMLANFIENFFVKWLVSWLVSRSNMSTFFFKKNGQYRLSFVYFRSFITVYTEKPEALAGFELGYQDLKANMLTT